MLNDISLNTDSVRITISVLTDLSAALIDHKISLEMLKGLFETYLKGRDHFVSIGNYKAIKNNMRSSPRLNLRATSFLLSTFSVFLILQKMSKYFAIIIQITHKSI